MQRNRCNDRKYSALECPVCFEVYVEPKQLLCGHSICRQCLDSMALVEDNTQITCPFCRSATSGKASDLPKNYALEDLVRSVVAQSNSCSKCSRPALNCAFICYTCDCDNRHPNLLCVGCACEHHYNTRHPIESFERRTDDIHEACAHEVERVFESNTKPLNQSVRNLQESLSRLSTSLQKHVTKFRTNCDIVIGSRSHRALFLKQHKTCMKHGKIIEMLGNRTCGVVNFVGNLLDGMTDTLEKFLPNAMDDPDVTIQNLGQQFAMETLQRTQESSIQRDLLFPCYLHRKS